MTDLLLDGFGVGRQQEKNNKRQCPCTYCATLLMFYLWSDDGSTTNHDGEEDVEKESCLKRITGFLMIL